MKNLKANPNIATIILGVISVIMMIAGIFNGEPLVVLNKAINVCMECIGIG